MHIPFCKVPVLDDQFEQLQNIDDKSFDNKEFYSKCVNWFENQMQSIPYLTNSCTSALEIAALATDLQRGDEVILPSYTFAGTANAIARTGATPVFVDIEPNTMNIDVEEVLNAISSQTKAIFCVHYGGVAADMEKLLSISEQYGLYLVEDAAHGISSYFKNKHLGSIGHIGCISFDEQKNISCGQGGALLVNDQSLLPRVEQIFENGTNKSAFLRGEESQYSWLRTGGNYKMAEINAAWLYPQFQRVKEITDSRKRLWQVYFDGLKKLEEQGNLELPHPLDFTSHNAHIFYIKAKSIHERSVLVNYLLNNGIETKPHYVPLHSSPMGSQISRFAGRDRFTTEGSNRLLRLPLYFGLAQKKVQYVVNLISHFYKRRASE